MSSPSTFAALSYRERCKAANKPCAVDGCSGWAFARGLCDGHYHRLNKHGDPLGGAGPKAPNGSGFITDDGYRAFTVDGRIKREHIAIAERALGKPLPAGAVVHHVDEDKLNNEPSNLVVCPDQSYHKLIHARMRAHEKCGHYDWLACTHCKQFDAPENLRIYHPRGRTLAFHPACNQEYQRRRRAEKRS